jgi:hypothetical protein
MRCRPWRRIRHGLGLRPAVDGEPTAHRGDAREGCHRADSPCLGIDIRNKRRAVPAPRRRWLLPGARNRQHRALDLAPHTCSRPGVALVLPSMYGAASGTVSGTVWTSANGSDRNGRLDERRQRRRRCRRQSYGFYERYFGSRRSLRIGKIKEVLRDREDKVLFSESIPDEALRPLAASAKEFRLKCSEAKALTRSGSSVRHDLKTCLDAAALFEYQVQQMLKQLERSDPSLRSDPNVFVYADDKKHLDDLKAQLRDTTREPASRLATSL